MLISKTIEIDMGHRVPNHKSKCRHLHGHRYKIECGVDDRVITEKGTSSEGMVIDYGDLKDILKLEIEDKFDHKFVTANNLYTPDIFNCFSLLERNSLGIITVDFIPTAENLAKHWYELIKPKLKQRDINIRYVKVWETPTSTATYEE